MKESPCQPRSQSKRWALLRFAVPVANLVCALDMGCDAALVLSILRALVLTDNLYFGT